MYDDLIEALSSLASDLAWGGDGSSYDICGLAIAARDAIRELKSKVKEDADHA